MATKKLKKAKGSLNLKTGALTIPDAPAAETKLPAGTYNGYCVKCKDKRDYEGAVEVSKTGMNMAKGKCPVCGTTICRILGKAKG